MPVPCWSTSSVCSLPGLCCLAQMLSLWNFGVLKIPNRISWMKLSLCFAPQNSFLHACTSFLGRAAKNKMDFIVCKDHVVWFSCTDPGAGREQGRAHWAGFVGPGVFQGWHEPVPMASLSGLFSWETPGSRSAVPVWMWMCGCGLTAFACYAIPHCLRPEWGGILALGVPTSPSLYSC